MRNQNETPIEVDDVFPVLRRSRFRLLYPQAGREGAASLRQMFGRQRQPQIVLADVYHVGKALHEPQDNQNIGKRSDGDAWIALSRRARELGDVPRAARFAPLPGLFGA